MLRRWWLPSAFAEQNKATWGGDAGRAVPPGLLPGPAWGHAAHGLLPGLGGGECQRDLEGHHAAPRCQGAAGSPVPRDGCCHGEWEQLLGWGGIACGCGSGTRGHVPSQPTQFPGSVLLCALCSQLSPGCAWHSPRAPGKTISLYFLLPWILQIPDPSKQRELFSLTISSSALAPFSQALVFTAALPLPSIPDTAQAQLPEAGPGSSSYRREEKASQAAGCWKTGAGAQHKPRLSIPRLARTQGSAASPPRAPATPASRAGGINLCSQAICELSHSALHPAAC